MNDAAFDEVIDRSGSRSSRWGGKGDILALTVGDADFRIPPAMERALRERLSHGVLGYDRIPGSLVELLTQRLLARYGWRTEPDWFVFLPGVVQGLNLCCRAFCAPGQAIISESPVYYPFLEAPGNAARELHTLPALCDGVRWSMDLDLLARQAGQAGSQLFLLCNPQNPLGRVMTRSELQRVAEICLANDLLVCSDEIHCDVLYQGEHIPIASLGPDIAARTITLMSPSKAFAMSGLGIAFAIIPDAGLRRRFRKAGAGLIPSVNALALTAMEAAYSECDDWLQDQLACLAAARDLVCDFFERRRGVSTTKPEATCFLWLDFRAGGFNDPFRAVLDTGVELSDGGKFGQPGFLRLNFASPRARLREALDRMANLPLALPAETD